ncbi:MAG: hypothetical protein Fur0010_15630 [Bdellovibrio sp.]
MNFESNKINTTLELSKIVITETLEGYEYIKNHIFPKYCEYFLFSAVQGSHLSGDVYQQVLEELRNNDQLNVLVFGAGAISKVEIFTPHLLIMDPFLMNSISRWNSDKPYKIEWNDDRLIWFMKSFFHQENFKKRSSPSNKSEYLKLRTDGQTPLWVHQLLGLK